MSLREDKPSLGREVTGQGQWAGHGREGEQRTLLATVRSGQDSS